MYDGKRISFCDKSKKPKVKRSDIRTENRLGMFLCLVEDLGLSKNDEPNAGVANVTSRRTIDQDLDNLFITLR